jgi:cellobiose phosphorylase
MDVNATTWYYKLEEDILKIEVAIAPIKNVIVLRAQSLAGNKYDFILTQVLVMGNDEYLHPLNLDIQEEQIDYFFDESTLAHQKYPELSYRTFFNTDGTYQISTDEVFYQDHKSRNNPLLSFEVNNATSFSLEIWGINKMEEVDNQQKIEDLRKDYQTIHQNAYRSFHLDISQDNENYLEIQKFNILVPWYLHNALVHYAAPHGLEQYGGGAWGTRDICQGPIELFTALGRFDLVKKIILKVYERQFIETGDWPQWFMFDAFEEIQADSSHGDIIVWPLYALSNYLINTGDKSILEIKTPYTSLSGKRVSEASIRDHVLKQIETMKRNFIPGTSLPSYGGGDWNDTLQPRHSEDRENMSSSWTTALTIQALENFLFSCPEENDIRIILNNMKKDYRQYFLKDNIPAGFVEIKDQKVKYILHPEDEVTGIKYRLLSFNQGFTAELFDELELSKYLDIIDEHLMHPDGVRLMDKTVKYQGGTPEIFMRAETATNFGREIGLQYVHAHIRYIEAMAKVGEGERLFTGLKKINPILIKDNVPNAKTRQSNVYFSSSDGDFINRYQADQHFDDLRKGKVAVKGGWRLYSSGPGIYLNQLIANFLGIKTIEDQLYIDPILPISCNGLEFEFIYKQYHLKLRYEVTRASTIEYLIINGKKIERNTNFLRYRDSGVLIPNSYLKKNNEIIVRI